MTKDLARPIKLFTSLTKAVVQKTSLFGKDISRQRTAGLTTQRLSGLYYKHITIVNDNYRVMLKPVASLTIIMDDTS
jgi:hypothetical protein